MKKNYTRKQITEAIAYWKGVLSQLNEDNNAFEEALSQVKSNPNIKKIRTENGDELPVATCKDCVSERIIVSSNCVDPADPSTYSFTVSCPNCHHNISARTVSNAIKAWDKEFYDEDFNEFFDPSLWATEITEL